MKSLRSTALVAVIGAALGLAACGGGGASSSTPAPTPTPTPTPAAPTPSTSSGIAFIPGGTLAADANSMTVVQYEDTSGALLKSPVVTEYGTGVKGIGVAQVAAGTDNSTGVLLTQAFSTLSDSIMAGSVKSATYAALGNALDLRTTMQQPYSVAVMPDNSTMLVTGETVLAQVTGLTAGSAQISTQAYPTQLNPGMLALAISPDGKTLITRGQSATFFWNIAANSGGGYQLTAVGTDNGVNGSVAGRGDMAFDPQDSTRALFGWSATGDQLTLETGLPASPAETAILHLNGSTLYSIAFTPDGKYAVIGSHDGIYVVSGMDSGTLTQVQQNGTAGVYTTSFTDYLGATEQLGAVYSVGVSSDGKYVSALAGYTDVNGSLHEALIAIPISSSGTLGTSTTVVSDLKTRGSILSSDGTLFQ